VLAYAPHPPQPQVEALWRDLREVTGGAMLAYRRLQRALMRRRLEAAAAMISGGGGGVQVVSSAQVCCAGERSCVVLPVACLIALPPLPPPHASPRTG
jgi:hypothetical protein